MVRASNEKYELLLLGTSPSLNIETGCWPPEYPTLGWCSETYVEGHVSCEIAVWNYYENNFGYFANQGCYSDRITGLYDGDHFLNIPPPNLIQSLWAKACNKVRFDSYNYHVWEDKE